MGVAANMGGFLKLGPVMSRGMHPLPSIVVVAGFVGAWAVSTDC